MVIAGLVLYAVMAVSVFRLTEAVDRKAGRQSPLWENVLIGVIWPVDLLLGIWTCIWHPDKSADDLEDYCTNDKSEED